MLLTQTLGRKDANRSNRSLKFSVSLVYIGSSRLARDTPETLYQKPKNRLTVVEEDAQLWPPHPCAHIPVAGVPGIRKLAAEYKLAN